MEAETGSDSPERRVCAPCLRKKTTTLATVYCRMCKQFQCSECQSFHSIFPGMFGHDIVEADTVEPGHEVDLKGLDICSDHGKMLEFLCKDHDILCCSTCAITEHRPCGKILEIKKIISERADPEEDLKQKLASHRTREESLITHFENIKANALIQIDNINEMVKHIERQFKELMEKSKQKLISETAKIRKDILQNIAHSKEITETVQTSTAEASEWLERTVKYGNPIQTFICFHNIRCKHIPGNTSVIAREERNKDDNKLTLKFRSPLQALLDSDVELMKVSVVEKVIA